MIGAQEIKFRSLLTVNMFQNCQTKLTTKQRVLVNEMSKLVLEIDRFNFQLCYKFFVTFELSLLVEVNNWSFFNCFDKTKSLK